MLMLPFTGYGIYRYSGAGRYFSIFTTTAILLMILFLRTRSVWVGTGFGVMVFFIGIMAYHKKLQIKKSLLKKIMLSFSALAILGLVYIFAGRGGDYSIPTLVKSISDPYSATNINRVKIWEVTGEMITDNPVLGVGAGNWKLNAGNYFSKTHFDKSLLNWLRPHNDYLWVWSVKGIFGLIAFLGIFVISLIYVFRIIHDLDDPDEKFLTLFIIAGILAYIFISIFTFPLERINHQIYVCLYLAVISVLSARAFPSVQKQINSRFNFFSGIPILVFAFIYSYSIYDAEKKVMQCRAMQFSKQWIPMYNEALKIPNTFRSLDSDGTPISWYAGLSADNSGNTKQAITAYKQAVKQHPGHVKSHNNLGVSYIKTKQYKEAIPVLEQATFILPNYLEAKINLASAYFRYGNFSACLRVLSSIPDYQMTDRINGFKESVMINPKLVPAKFFDLESPDYSGNPVDKYEFYIRRDPDWLEAVKQKAADQNFDIDDFIIADAHFIAFEKEPEMYLLWNGLEFYKKTITNDQDWLSHVQAQARKKNNELQEELEAHARTQFAADNPTAYVMFVEIEKQKKQLLANKRIRKSAEQRSEKIGVSLQQFMDVKSFVIASAVFKSKSSYDEKIDGYIASIKRDKKWLKVVRAKAKQKKTSLEDELIGEAKYMILRDGR